MGGYFHFYPFDTQRIEEAKWINKKHTFISKVETDGENITLKTLFDVVERGLGGRLKISVEF